MGMECCTTRCNLHKPLSNFFEKWKESDEGCVKGFLHRLSAEFELMDHGFMRITHLCVIWTFQLDVTAFQLNINVRYYKIHIIKNIDNFSCSNFFFCFNSTYIMSNNIYIYNFGLTNVSCNFESSGVTISPSYIKI